MTNRTHTVGIWIETYHSYHQLRYTVKKIWNILLYNVAFSLNRQLDFLKLFFPCLPFQEHLSSPPVFSGVRVTRSLVLCVYFVDRCYFLLAIVLSVLLQFTGSDYPFGIFKLFFLQWFDFYILLFFPYTTGLDNFYNIKYDNKKRK